MKNRVLLAALLLTSTPLFAGNLLTNATFPTDLSGWDYVGAATWNSSDALTQASSGSLVGTNNAASPFTYVTLLISTCLPVTGGAAFDGSLDSRIPAGQGVTATASIEIAWYGAGGCSGIHYLGSNILVASSDADGVWHRSEASSAVHAPALAAFATVRLTLSKTEAGGIATAYFDNVVFKPQGTCGSLPDRLCLNNNRFQVTSTWENYAGQSGVGLAQAMTAETGYFWFFSAANVEVVVKVINGCSLNSNYWIYAGG
ncbi:MAG: hypothetical protein ABIV06_02485, partial [Thermoanaerobaculia bacterium]